MKRAAGLTLCFVLLATLAAADEAAVKTIAFDNLHIRVPDTAKAGAWYVKYLGATPTDSAHRVSFGRTLIVFSKGEPAGPSTVIDHIGVSYPNLDGKLKELTAGGAKIVTPAEDRVGLFRLAFIEDPFGVKIELVQDPELVGFHHVHLRVPNPEATLNRYQEIFGGQRNKLKGRIDGLLYAAIPQGVAGPPKGSKSSGGVWLLAAKSDTKLEETDKRVIYNLAFLVQDINQAATALKAKQFTFTREVGTVKVEGLDTGVAIVRDPDGVQIELLQRQREQGASRD
jgi:lactoylglutathione lyase